MGDSGVVDFAAGGVGGVLQVIVGHPFDTLKIQLVTGARTGSLGSIAAQTLKNEGPTGFYKGVASPLVGLMAINAVLFYSQGVATRFLSNPAEKELPLSKVFIAGMFAGSCVSFVECPVDLFKTKMQVQVKDAHGNFPYKSTFNCAQQITVKHGLRGVFQGIIATQIRNVPSYSLYFGVYELFKRSFSNGGEVSGTAAFFAGGLGGMAYWCITYPLDAIKSVLQSQPSALSERKYQSYSIAARTIYQQSGLRGFYKGYTPCVLRSFPANAACFLGYEAVKKFFA